VTTPRPTVFIVEDDADTRDMLEQFLELEGYHVETAVNGRHALDRLSGGLQASVIVLDLMMPVMDGLQFRREQVRRTELASIPVIVVSAAGQERLQRIEADAHLPKPIDLEQLLDRINEWCAR
jgi:CheY-like chemotaxis protein